MTPSRVIKQQEEILPPGNFHTSGPRIIAVSSGKGGVGKTSITLNLAIALSKAGNRVIIFDADLGLANVEVLAGLVPEYSLYDCLKGSAGIKDVLVPGPAGIQLVSGGTGLVELANLSDRYMQKLIDSLSVLDSEADFILIDTAAGISKNVLAFIAAVNELVLVLTPEPTSITDAYTLAKIVSRYRLHKDVNMVVNRARGRREATQAFQKFDTVCAQFLNIKINYLGYLPEDSMVSHAIKEQYPFILAEPNSTLSKCINSIGSRITDTIQDNNAGFGIKDFATRLTRLFRR